MTGWIVLAAAAFALWAAYVVVSVGPHFWTRRDRGGRADRGLVIFVESIRWLGVAWGMRTVARGLRQAGFEGRFLYWRWHRRWRGWLVLPAIRDRALLASEARKLAGFIADRRRRCGEVPIHVIGYSCGGFVAVRALELLPPGVAVDGAALLAAAFAPDRDLSAACDHVRGGLVVCSSGADWLIVGLGTLVWGTADGRHTFSVGAVGVRGPSAGDPRVRSIRWHPGLARLGHWGGHFAASAAGFVRCCVAPALGIAPGTSRPDYPSVARIRR